MFKIQTRAINQPDLVPDPDKLQEWQYLENMPDLPTRQEAETWLQQSALQTLGELGFEFQIVEVAP